MWNVDKVSKYRYVDQSWLLLHLVLYFLQYLNAIVNRHSSSEKKECWLGSKEKNPWVYNTVYSGI